MTVTVTVKFAVVVLEGRETVTVLFDITAEGGIVVMIVLAPVVTVRVAPPRVTVLAVVTVLAGPLSPGVKPGITPGVLDSIDGICRLG